ncbi:hypothetical protein SAMN02745163_03487 [Clostridium cavendishii DSM 21758]|uniref:Uncharacterized protein n=1 Tax=Clostridium cavendishii DSM 21758 TaxID=1121302 RepID=A0A1M6QXR2_9CLOT|nr:hypothetical protein [Clostridium cavendishii]SHK24930.1 hypothetical protein SAMN02745163_03487 [Clostridium cavendishii DSM 21758]
MFTKKQKIALIITCILSITITATASIVLLKPNNLNDFKEYVRNYKINFEHYILDKNEDTYKDLIAESEEAISNKDDKKILELKPKLKELEKKVIAEDTDLINSGLQEVKSIDISNLPEDKKKRIDSLLSEVDTLCSEKNFLKANTNIVQAKTAAK